MLVTLLGVSIVILERHQTKAVPSTRNIRVISLKGVLLGFGAMLGQAMGYILSKVGMPADSGYLEAFSATQIRAVVFTTIGSAFGPFLNVSLSLLVLHYLTVGVASTFLSLVPVFIIPFSIFLHKEHVSIRSISGALIAVFGIYLLMA